MAQTQLIPIIIASVSLLYLAALKLKLPPQLVLISGGLLLGLLPALANFELDPFIVFNLLAPPLLYGAAVTASVQVLRFNLFTAVLPILIQFGLSVATLALVCGWLIPGLNGAGAILLGVIGAAGGDVFRAARQPLHTPRRVEEFLEVENLVTPIFLVTLLILALQATLSKSFGLSDILTRLGLDLGLGVALGIALAFGLVWLRRQVAFAAVIEIAVGFGTPYLFNAVAGLIGISSLPMVIAGGFAVAVAYFRRPASDRGVSSLYRIEANGFWLVTNLLLGGMTLFLIGLGLPGAFRKVQASYGWEVLIYALAILILGQLIRFGVAYFTFQTSSKLASSQNRNSKTWAEALVVAWSGARSFFAVLMVLVLPQTTPAGQPFILRDLFVVLVCLTTLISLSVQGLTLPWLVRQVGLADSPEPAQQEQLVRRELAQAALQKLNEYSYTNDEEHWLIANLARQYQQYWPGQAPSNILPIPSGLKDQSEAVSRLPQDHDHETDLALKKLRQTIVSAKAHTLHSLRERNLIADEVLARYQLELDLEAEWLKSLLFTA